MKGSHLLNGHKTWSLITYKSTTRLCSPKETLFPQVRQKPAFLGNLWSQFSSTKASHSPMADGTNGCLWCLLAPECMLASSLPEYRKDLLHTSESCWPASSSPFLPYPKPPQLTGFPPQLLSLTPLLFPLCSFMLSLSPTHLAFLSFIEPSISLAQVQNASSPHRSGIGQRHWHSTNFSYQFKTLLNNSHINTKTLKLSNQATKLELSQ